MTCEGAPLKITCLVIVRILSLISSTKGSRETGAPHHCRCVKYISNGENAGGRVAAGLRALL
jgi:hypothetical protein